jgi:hypothetical protein
MWKKVVLIHGMPIRTIRQKKYMENLQVVPTTAIFTTTSLTNVWEANYYMADLGSLTSFQVKITDLPVTFNNVNPSMANRSLAT